MKHQVTDGSTSISFLALPYTVDTATLELLAGWRSQDATDDPDELRAAEQELADFKKAMNERRAAAGEPVLYP
jgi:hypothetical protein